MRQTLAELSTALDVVKERSRSGIWRPAPDNSIELQIVTVDTSDNISLSSIHNLLDYFSKYLMVDFALTGGGAGCTDMRFTSEHGDLETIGTAIETDPILQNILNEIHSHFVRVKVHSEVVTFTAFVKNVLLFVTDRDKKVPTYTPELGTRGAFGSEYCDILHYGIATVLNLDLTKNQSKESLLKRVWKRFYIKDNELQMNWKRTIIQDISILSNTHFSEVLASFNGTGVILHVHGYANNFDDALQSTVQFLTQARSNDLGLLAILFSWPSHGDMLKYLVDIDKAEVSEAHLSATINLITEKSRGKSFTIVGHSHGNKVLLRAICAAEFGRVAPIKNVIFVEPDVSSKLIENNFEKIISATERIVMYFSRHDMALAISSTIFGGRRTAGASGVIAPMKLVPQRIEIIDWSAVGSGVIQHTPHINSNPVISDIYYVLRGLPAAERFNLRKAEAQHHWKLCASK